MINKKHIAALSLFLDYYLGLSFGADKKDTAALACFLGYKIIGLSKQPHGFIKIDYIDTIAWTENIRFHLRIPAPGLVPEMEPCPKHLFHGDF